MTFVWFLFVLARYLALSIHMYVAAICRISLISVLKVGVICSANVVFAILWMSRLPDHQPLHGDCVTWLIFQVISCHTVLLILELILRFDYLLAYRNITDTFLVLEVWRILLHIPRCLISNIHQYLLCTNKV